MKHRSPRKSKKQISKFLIIIPLILLAVAVLVIFGSKSSYDGITRYNFVVDSDPVTVFSINPKEHSALILSFSGGVYLDIPYGYGRYSAQNIYRLGNLDQMRSGGELLASSIENTLAVNIDGYIHPENGILRNVPEINEDNLLNIKNDYFSLHGIISNSGNVLKFLKNTDSNITLIDKFRIWKEIRGIRSDNITFIDLGKMNIYTEDKLSDGTPVKYFDRDLLDSVVSNKLYDSNIRNENISIEIINTTNRDGLAQQLARVLVNLGANIVKKNSEEGVGNFNCLLRMDNEKLKNSFIVKKIKKLYSCRDEVKNTQGNISDITFILGKDFMK